MDAQKMESRCHDDVWIFGYGSLVWKTNFAYTDTLVGHIKAFKRRFWQGSADHRGTPDSPGRVATILPTGNPDDQVWGRCYKLDKDELETTFKYLNHREKNGYELHTVLFHPANGELAFEVPLYISSEENPHFLGEAPVEEMARHIFSSIGPSGANLDYFLNLLEFMRDNVPDYTDDHLLELEEPIRKLMSEGSPNENTNNTEQRLVRNPSKAEIISEIMDSVVLDRT